MNPFISASKRLRPMGSTQSRRTALRRALPAIKTSHVEPVVKMRAENRHCRVRQPHRHRDRVAVATGSGSGGDDGDGEPDHHAGAERQGHIVHDREEMP